MDSNNNDILLKFSVMMLANSGLDLLYMGKELVNTGFDELTSGGFWIWEIGKDKRFYSPLFRKNIGYEGEHDFPSNNKSWRNIIKKDHLEVAINKLNKVLSDGDDSEYFQIIECYNKKGEKLSLICSGKILMLDGKYKYLVGTHTKI